MHPSRSLLLFPSRSAQLSRALLHTFLLHTFSHSKRTKMFLHDLIMSFLLSELLGNDFNSRVHELGSYFTLMRMASDWQLRPASSKYKQQLSIKKLIRFHILVLLFNHANMILGILLIWNDCTWFRLPPLYDHSCVAVCWWNFILIFSFCVCGIFFHDFQFYCLHQEISPTYGSGWPKVVAHLFTAAQDFASIV